MNEEQESVAKNEQAYLKKKNRTSRNKKITET